MERETNNGIMYGGGWRQTWGKPRARIFGYLSLYGLGIAVYASSPFWSGWPSSMGWFEWSCCGFLSMEAVFILLALNFLLTEKPRQILARDGMLDGDLRKL